jgi:ABC-type bacteriocin/lantibiotic exporter with double-glycine peptidase domain
MLEAMKITTWRDQLALARPVWKRLAASIFASAFNALLVIPLPLLVARVIDHSIPSHNRLELIVIGLSMVGLTVFGGLFGILERKLALSITRGAITELRVRLIDKVLHLSREQHLERGVGDLHDVVVNDTDRVDSALTTLLRDMVPGAMMASALIVLLLIRSPLLTLVTVGVGSLWALVNRLFYRRFQVRFEKFHRASRGFSDNTIGLLRTVDLTRAHAAEQEEIAKARQLLGEVRSTSISRSMALCHHRAVHQSATAMVGAAILITGGLATIDGRMTIGSVFSFFAGFALLRSPLNSLSDGFPSVIEGRVALGRISALLDSDRCEPYRGTSCPSIEGRFVLDQVSFGYADSDVVHEFDMALTQGRTTALVGPNGSGKSTVVNLLLGQYEPRSGSVTVDGRDYAEIDMRHLRKNIGIVSQDPMFLRASIRENLVYGAPDADAESIDWALRMAGADRVVASLRDGLDTMMADDARNISGGQRQRIAVARALARRPKLLILDEPTNHLDREAIAGLLVNMRSWRDRPAVLIVSHHAAAVDLADEIVHLDGAAEPLDVPPTSMVAAFI